MDMKIQERIGKIIPNEFSKLAGYLKYIPYVGPAMATVGAVDAGATANSDIYNRMKEEGASSKEARLQAYSKGIPYGLETYQSGNDPGYFGSQGHINDDWANKIGSTGSFFGKGQMFGGGGKGTQGMGAGDVFGMYGKGKKVARYWDGTDNMGYDPALAGTKYADPNTGYGWVDSATSTYAPWNVANDYGVFDDNINKPIVSYGNNNLGRSPYETYWS